jgi:PadR family transcriptional regulator, regulatory protein PadR
MIFREFLLGFVRIHVLHRAARGPVYGLALLDELRQHGYALGPGTLYPLLQALEETGYLDRENRVVGGRVRKYYVLTHEGARALAGARPKIRGLVGEVLESRGPARLEEPRKLTMAERRPVNLIQPEILHARLAANLRGRAPVVIDVRGNDEYVAAHIPGARHIPVAELATRCDELSRRRLQVTYCNMRHRSNSRSVRAATLLRRRGHQAQALEGGLPAWVAAGYPVDRGLPRVG